MKQVLRSTLATLVLWTSFLILTIFSPVRQNMIIYVSIVLVYVLVSLAIKIWEAKKEDRVKQPSHAPPAVSQAVQSSRKGDSAQDMFQKNLHKTVSYAKRKHKIMALLFIHAHGKHGPLDEKIRDTVIRQITEVLRTEDVILALDNDEFVVLLGDIGQARFAGLVAEK